MPMVRTAGRAGPRGPATGAEVPGRAERRPTERTAITRCGLPVFAAQAWQTSRGEPAPVLSRGDPDYLPNRHLTHRLATAIRSYLDGRRDLLVIDVGAGEKPYAALLTPYARRHIAIDHRPRPGSTDLTAVSEQLPL